MNHLAENVKATRVLNAVAAGTTVQNSTAVDMSGFDGVCFVAAFGALTATQVTAIHAEQSATNTSSAFLDLAGTNTGPLADTDSGQLLILDVLRPSDRYVRCVVDRATANAVIDGVIAFQYNARDRVVTQDSGTVMTTETHVSPAEGTK